MHFTIVYEGRLLIFADAAGFYFIRLVDIFSIGLLQVG